MQPISFEEASKLFNAVLAAKGGIFLSTAGACAGQEEACAALDKGDCADACAGERPNTMTIGWGAMGVFWGINCLLAPIRPSRYTHARIEQSKTFTVSVPLHDMRDAWRLCGTKSGRDINKFEAAGITPEPAQTVAAPIVGECELHIECKVLSCMQMDSAAIPEKVLQSFYAKGDYHTLFFGEVTACYMK